MDKPGFLLELAEQLAHAVGDVGIERGGGFVEQEEARFVEQCLGEVDAGGLAGGELAGDGFAEVGDVEQFEQFVDPLFGARHAVELGEDG